MDKPKTPETPYQRALPYAKAVFGIALQDDTLEHWHETLKELARFIEDDDVSFLIRSRHTTKKDLHELMEELAFEANATKKEFKFINVLIEDGCLDLAPLIFEHFSRMKSEIDRKYAVTVLTAQELTQEQQENLKHYLREKFNIHATIQQTCVPELQAGFKVIFGDTTIDQSMQRQKTLKK